MTDPNVDLKGAQPPAPATDPKAAPAPEGPPAWFKEFAERVEGKFTQIGQDFGRIREKIKPDTKDPAEGAKPTEAVVTREELTAATDLGVVMAGLPEAAQARTRERIASEGYRAALAFAKDLAALLPAATAGGPAPVAPIGAPATGPKVTAPVLPQTQQEYLELKKIDPKRFAALQADDTFDPSSLPQSRAQLAMRARV